MPSPDSQATNYKCPDCSAISPKEDWKKCQVWCGDCHDEHTGIECPKCGYATCYAGSGYELEDLEVAA
jgi:DNA-directed RNA polymerase subunit RPC12/RpoP